MRRQFAAMGVTIAAQEQDKVAEPDAVFVWDINWDSLMAFRACGTQWREIAGFGALAWSGLDYAGVDVVLKRRGAPNEAFNDICVMEQEALDVFDRHAGREDA